MSQVELLVCTKCRKGEDIPEDGTRPGAALLAAMDGVALPEGVSLRAVECLSNCSAGCTVGLRGGPGRWTYVYGNLAPDQTDILVEGAALYAATSDGVVPWRERPAHFRKNCVARMPPQEF